MDRLPTGARMIGRTLGPYTIKSKIGEGGMGVVYQAHDSNLDRMVAIKVLPPDKTADPARKQRFVHEAKAASALNHPNIVTIHDIRSVDGIDFIVMEYVDGKTLDELIPPKGMRPAKALRYAVEIADAVAKAHAASILHRDLKPSNIMVTGDGHIKILDFGLAKLLDAPDNSPDTPTRTLRDITEEGAVVGTAAYMSPEQAEGRKLDGRSDIFSFGSVLYEMVTSRRSFSADSRLALLTKIVHEDPPPPSQIAPVPPEVDKLILRCLRKEPSRRFQTMADLKVALEDLESETSAPQTHPSGAPAHGLVSSRRTPLLRSLALFVIAGLAALTLAVLGIRAFRKTPEAIASRTVKFTIAPVQLAKGSYHDSDVAVFISGDGKRIAYVESPGGQLWVRDIDQEQAHLVPGATGVYEAFWSPDSQFIGYAAGEGCGARACDLVKIPAAGGTPVPICRLAGAFKRASWSSDGETIVFGDATGLYTVPARGGSPTRILEHPHIEHPSFLDLSGGRRALLYQAVDPDKPGGHGIYVQMVGENRRRFLTLSTNSNPYPAYSPTGHIVYVDGNYDSSTIWALPFSLDTLQPSGKAFPIAQHGTSPRVSTTGTLVYSDVPTNHMQLVWCDRSGKTLSTIGEPMRQDGLSLSPDGHKLAVESRESEPDMWIYDLDRGVKTRFTFDSTLHTLSAWTPSGDEITYSFPRKGNFDIFSKPSSGNSEAKLLVSTPLQEVSPDWSPDRRFLIYMAGTRDIKRQLLFRERRPDGSMGDAVYFQKTPFNEDSPRFSPDGRFVVYVSDESGRNEIYVRDFPKAANKWRISLNGGSAPRWRRDGKEILYLERSKLMAASVTSHPAFSPGVPVPLFEQRSLQIGYDVSADGKKFIMLEKPSGEPPLLIHVVHNWYEEFRNAKI